LRNRIRPAAWIVLPSIINTHGIVLVCT
jgi:hypothetical protein